MKLQYLTDNEGKTTGVFIPIHDWEYLKNKYSMLERGEENDFEIPEWQIGIVHERLLEYRSNPENVVDWTDVQKEIEEKYGF
jgi:hypothetical protein